MVLRTLASSLFPYTTLFRSRHSCCSTVHSTAVEIGVLVHHQRALEPGRRDVVLDHLLHPLEHLELVALVVRSEEHSLNSSHGYISYAVFCLKKKNRARGGRA